MHKIEDGRTVHAGEFGNLAFLSICDRQTIHNQMTPRKEQDQMI